MERRRYQNRAAPGINSAPLYNDCRWKTQNVSVHDNTFNHNPGAIAGCSPSTGCGYNGIFSNWGTFPSWSPYQGQKIQDAITFSQNNVFARNTYKGPWQFMAHDHGDGHQLHDVAGRSLQPRRRQHDHPMTETGRSG